MHGLPDELTCQFVCGIAMRGDWGGLEVNGRLYKMSF